MACPESPSFPGSSWMEQHVSGASDLLQGIDVPCTPSAWNPTELMSCGETGQVTLHQAFSGAPGEPDYLGSSLAFQAAPAFAGRSEAPALGDFNHDYLEPMSACSETANLVAIAQAYRAPTGACSKAPNVEEIGQTHHLEPMGACLETANLQAIAQAYRAPTGTCSKAPNLEEIGQAYPGPTEACSEQLQVIGQVYREPTGASSETPNMQDGGQAHPGPIGACSEASDMQATGHPRVALTGACSETQGCSVNSQVHEEPSTERFSDTAHLRVSGTGLQGPGNDRASSRKSRKSAVVEDVHRMLMTGDCLASPTGPPAQDAPPLRGSSDSRHAAQHDLDRVRSPQEIAEALLRLSHVVHPSKVNPLTVEIMKYRLPKLDSRYKRIKPSVLEGPPLLMVRGQEGGVIVQQLQPPVPFEMPQQYPPAQQQMVCAGRNVENPVLHPAHFGPVAPVNQPVLYQRPQLAPFVTQPVPYASGPTFPAPGGMWNQCPEPLQGQSTYASVQGPAGPAANYPQAGSVHVQYRLEYNHLVPAERAPTVTQHWFNSAGCPSVASHQPCMLPDRGSFHPQPCMLPDRGSFHPQPSMRPDLGSFHPQPVHEQTNVLIHPDGCHCVPPGTAVRHAYLPHCQCCQRNSGHLGLPALPPVPGFVAGPPVPQRLHLPQFRRELRASSARFGHAAPRIPAPNISVLDIPGAGGWYRPPTNSSHVNFQPNVAQPGLATGISNANHFSLPVEGDTGYPVHHHHHHPSANQYLFVPADPGALAQPGGSHQHSLVPQGSGYTSSDLTRTNRSSMPGPRF